MTTIIDRFAAKARALSDTCSDSATIAQTTDAIKYGSRLGRLASVDPAVGGADPQVAEKLKKASSLLGEVAEGLGKGLSACHDIVAAGQIIKAIAVLNRWSEGKATSVQAAIAFDQLFGGAARFVQKLPPPLNAYSGLLEQLSIARFFSNVAREANFQNNNERGRLMDHAWNADKVPTP